MNFSTGWAALAALLFAVPAANAQGAPNGAARAPYSIVSDFDGPYAEMPPEAPAPRYGYGPSMLPATEVYTVLRENGFSPLGIPRHSSRIALRSIRATNAKTPQFPGAFSRSANIC
jgi:hypothetical protein